MKIFVIGAHGQVAKHLADIVAASDELEEVAMIRREEQVLFFEERGIEPLLMDLAEVREEELAEAMKGADAVVFSAGAGSKGTTDDTFKIDLDGAIKSMTAAEQAGIKRYVMVSTFRTGRDEMQKNNIRSYTIAKNYADEWLKNRTELDWTILHPGILANVDGAGLVKLGMGNEINEVPRPDVARVIAEVLTSDNTIHKEFEILNGETPVEEAVASI